MGADQSSRAELSSTITSGNVSVRRKFSRLVRRKQAQANQARSEFQAGGELYNQGALRLLSQYRSSTSPASEGHYSKSNIPPRHEYLHSLPARLDF